MIDARKTLQDFYQSYMENIEAPQKNIKIYTRICRYGLCFNLSLFLATLYLSVEEEASVFNLLRYDFIKAGLDMSYPFGGKDRYMAETARGMANTNECRIAFVRNQLLEKQEK
jgi:hypothetical protein